MARLKLNDKVVVIAGKDKGKEGVITRILNNRNSKKQKEIKVLVEGVNLVKKHQKANPQKGQAGGVVEMEKPLTISNLAILNQDSNKADKVRYKLDENNNKIRVYASTGEPIAI